jgi:hypothetical protein
MRSDLVARLKRLETVRAVEEGSHLPKFEFAYLKLLPREYEGPRHRVKVGQRPDGRDEHEERSGELPPDQGRLADDNVMRIYLVRHTTLAANRLSDRLAGGIASSRSSGNRL